ncbi:MAG: metallophosphoesterase family protein [Cypionkella sp.]
MRLALMSDIHANRAALTAVLADIDLHNIDQLVFLGDIVGHGSDPDWCLDTVEHLVKDGALCVRGNHDRAAASPDHLINPAARKVIDQTVNRLTARQRLFLGDLPCHDDVLFAHASADVPQDWAYVTDALTAGPSFAAAEARLIFCGHVHSAALYSCDSAGKVSAHAIANDMPLPLLRSRRWMGIVGSVGQPCDGSRVACYAVLDQPRNELTFQQIGYEAITSAQKSTATGLPDTMSRN